MIGDRFSGSSCMYLQDAHQIHSQYVVCLLLGVSVYIGHSEKSLSVEVWSQ